MGSGKILVIDDELFARRILENALSRNGFRVVSADGTSTAFEILKTEKVDAITCDLMMPAESGLDFLRKLKSAPALSHIPVVVITASGSPGMVEQAMKLGAVACVNKPFSQEELGRVIRQVIFR